MRRPIWYVLCFAAIVLTAFLPAVAQNPEREPVLTPAVQKHLKTIAESLPPDSGLRYGLEHGGHGDGAHHPWMDEMRRQGIRRALVRTEFRWHKKPMEVKATYFVYFSTYDGDCGQITDPQRLSKIRSSGLEAELSGQAVRDTLQGHWLFKDHAPRHLKRGIAVTTLLDDEWVPTWATSFSPPPDTEDPLEQAAGMYDVAAITALLDSGVSPQKRDGVVWALTGVPSPCTLKALLKAGVNPNMRDSDGSPLLTEEIRRDNFDNAKVLVEAGADVNAKDARGFTPLSIAEGMPDVPAMPDIIHLLKAAGARN